MFSIKSFKPRLPYALATLTLGFIALALYFKIGLNFNFHQSDVQWYLNDSLHWRTPFNPLHVPGYPLIIALLRALTFEIFPPMLLMMVITLTSLLIGASALYKIVKLYQYNDFNAYIAVCLYAFWPMVGLTYVAFPHSDIVALAFFMSGFLALLQNNLKSAGLWLGISLIVHKIMWPFVGLVIIADCLTCQFRILRDWKATLLLALPISLLWGFGAYYHHAITWIFQGSVAIGTMTDQNWPVLEGLKTIIVGGGLKALVKGGLIITFTLTAIGIIYVSLTKKFQNYQYAIAISTAYLLLVFTMSTEVLWSTQRFSRLLVIPVFWLFSIIDSQILSKRTTLSVLLIVSLLLSQFIFAWYMATIYFPAWDLKHKL